MWLGYLNDHICYEFCQLFGCKRKCLNCFGLGESVLAYSCSIGFLDVHHMLPKCLLFVFSTHFIRCNMWPLTAGTLRFPSFLIRVSFVGMTLTSDQTFLSWPTVFRRMAETLAVVTLRNETGVRNSSTLYTMPVTWQTRFRESRASVSVGSLISS